MKDPLIISETTTPSELERESHPAALPSRRKFMGAMGGVAAAAATIGVSPTLASAETQAEGSQTPPWGERSPRD